MRRVVITGAGTINALAHDVPGTIAALLAGQSGIGPLQFRDVERLSIRIGAQIRDWPGIAGMTAREASLWDPFTRYAIAAADEAVAMAGLSRDELAPAGVILGTAAGGIATWEDNYRAVYAEGRDRVPPLTVPRLMHNAAPSHISIRHGLRGASFSVSSACASANHALGLAFREVREGRAPVMLAGGAEAMLLFGGLKAWEGLRVLSPDGCRPFDARRNGMVMGEGAAIFVLEEAGHAKARGAMRLAEIAGFGMTADAADIVAPSVEGAVAAMQAALREAGLSPQEVAYVNAHGTGTQANDRAEAAALRQVFGASGPAVSSTKAAHGHAIGATGALELLAVIAALHKGQIAPTLGCESVDPDFGVDIVTGAARAASVGAALSNSFAFGGLNAVLALKRIP
ncbi:beta-ketoacyl-[acyl-carrier-protein] synthase family protein [Xinfangfangia sp. CPCC 101601]|uniref:Nodulation protein E n=1 Tax=Pseudogemmobacter lacusdianii TaxID=3069608 RepID=A0ABU0VUT1_9RHOB|nr:beta-ketoacyl-[acyl-carrier-protein] synthase family protein [Xinfangfangia sp. CPCC 101601]MDQ2065492.1 beta-ketoacyl-[acyl-carrier-protein] synthase family protein [Xinfangfangia sp. CPCC 101601]